MGGWHSAALPAKLSDTPSKHLCCFPQLPRTEPCLSLGQDLCGAAVARPRYNLVLGSPGLYGHSRFSNEQGW